MCGNVFQSHTCEIPPHLLPISGGHNTQQREESPQPIDSLDRRPTFIAAEKKRLAATQRTLHYPSLFLPPQFSISTVFFVHLFIHFYFGHLIFVSICYSHHQHLALFILKLEFLHQSFLLRCSQSSLRGLPILWVSTINFSHLYCLSIFIKQLLFPTPTSQLCELQCLVFSIAIYLCRQDFHLFLLVTPQGKDVLLFNPMVGMRRN